MIHLLLVCVCVSLCLCLCVSLCLCVCVCLWLMVTNKSLHIRLMLVLREVDCKTATGQSKRNSLFGRFLSQREPNKTTISEHVLSVLLSALL